MKDYNFSSELVNRVKKNWLTKENKQEFKNLKNNNDVCLTFVRVSNMTGREKMLSDEICKIVIKQMVSNDFKLD